MDKKPRNIIYIIFIIICLLAMLSYPIIVCAGTNFISNQDFTIKNIEIKEIKDINFLNNISDSYIIDNNVFSNNIYVYDVTLKAFLTVYDRKIVSNNNNLSNDEIKNLISNGENQIGVNKLHFE